MNNVLLTEITNIDNMLENYDYASAVNFLHDLAQKYPEEGVIPYYLGKVCLLFNNEKLAFQYIQTAIKKNYIKAEVYLTCALLQKDMQDNISAENSFQKALELADSEEIKWASFSCLAVFYIENEMFLKAEKIAKKIIKVYPDNYQGYHLHIAIETIKGNIEEAFSYMNMLPEKFKNHPQYLIDVIELYKKSENKDLAQLFSEDQIFSFVIPQIVLREKIVAMPNDEHVDEKEQLIIKLADEFHDKDAIVSLMILQFSKKNFKKSAQIANIVLENEKEEQGLRFFLALYYQIFNLYYLSAKKPSGELIKWIETAGNWCVNFVESFNIKIIAQPVKKVIQELFAEINNKLSL